MEANSSNPAPGGRVTDRTPDDPFGGPRVEAHPILDSLAVSFGARAIDGAKAFGATSLPPIADAFPGALTPVPLGPGEGADGRLTLDLKEGAPIDSVGSDTPVRVTTQAMDHDSAKSGDDVLLVGFDGESGMYLPMGFGAAGETGVEWAVTRLPSGQRDAPGGKSIGGALSMLALKLGASKIGLDNPYPLLRSAHAVKAERGGFRAEYDSDGATALQTRVASAQRIAVLAHGFTGDTRNMIAALPALDTFAPNRAGYDLVLAFDYETINTRIQDSALALKEKLAAIGLAPGHGKTVHLIAHSLGTQVSRWFIEREDGREIVTKAVLLGPPNDGTPLAAMQELLTVVVGLGLNGLLSVVAPWATLVWAIRALTSLVAGFEKIDTTLDQLKPGSDFYRDLNRSDDPGIPYRVIIGNTFKIQARPIDPKDSAGALLRQVFSENTRNRLLSLVFANQPNDLAISLASAERLATITPSRVPNPKTNTVACDHLSYFSSPAGLAALAAAVAD